MVEECARKMCESCFSFGFCVAESGERGQAISVSEIAVGDQILVALQEAAARHTGIAIQESIAER